MSEQLTDGERQVLVELIRHDKPILAGNLAQELKDSEQRVVSVLNSLVQRGLISLETLESELFSLTEEGRHYAIEGVPEVRLFTAVKNSGNKMRLDEAVSAAGLTQTSKGIAVNWSRRNGWLEVIKVDGDTMIEACVDEAVSQVAEVLTLLERGVFQIPDKLGDGLRQAIERTLVKREVVKSYAAELRKEKRRAIDGLLAKGREGIIDVTPEMLTAGSWKGKSFRPFNVELETARTNYGRKHPYAEFVDWLKEILVGLGFTEWSGPYVETEFWNNDALFVPQDHVAREVQDQFRVTKPYDHGTIPDAKYYPLVKAVHENGGDTGSKGWQWPFSKEISSRLCLRSHTTPVSMRYLSEHKDSPQKMFIIDRNFRAESLDARHGQEFDQCEGIILDKDLTLRDLLGYLSEICRRVGVKKIKFKPGQFPFTEPSVETFAKHETLGWIEVAPGGIFRPEVTYPLGIRDTVLAWGIGAMRLYMASLEISDIREILSRDLTWIRGKYFVR